MTTPATGESWLDPDTLGVQLVLLGATADDPPLRRALSTGLVAAVTAAASAIPALRRVCSDAATALLCEGGTADADGVLVRDPGEIAAIRKRIGPDAILGAACGLSRDDAMTAGEAGADWILFGAPDGDPVRATALAAWWSELFVLPCGVAGRITPADVPALIEQRIDFAALSPEIWSDAARLDALVEALRAA